MAVEKLITPLPGENVAHFCRFPVRGTRRFSTVMHSLSGYPHFAGAMHKFFPGQLNSPRFRFSMVPLISRSWLS